MYYIWWNDSGQGNDTNTGNIVVSAFRSNGEPITGFTDVDSAWSTAKTYSAPAVSDPSERRSETILLRVELKDNDVDNAGSFAIVYSTSTSKPPIFPSSGITPLTAGVWKDGTIAINSEDWYSLSVINGATYYFWWNETGSYGNGTKSADIRVGAWYSNGTPANTGPTSPFVDRDYGWSTPVSFTATSSGTLYVRVINTTPGTYGIVYNTSNTKPAVPFVVDATALTAAVWKDGDLPDSVSMDWYSISVTDGSTYYLWWNERGGESYGNYTKTADVYVSVLTNEGSALTITNKDTSWTTDIASFEASYDGTVYVKVVPKVTTSFGNTTSYHGTYGILYNTSNTKPIAPFNVPVTQLAKSVWKDDGNLSDADSTDWYTIAVTSGESYWLWWNDRNYGNSTKTGDIKVTILTNESSYLITDRHSSWTTNIATFEASYTGTVYIKVEPWNNTSYFGTYGIVYNTSNARPTVPFSIPATPLTENKWENGELLDKNSSDVYSISVTSDTTYRLWWNERNSNAGKTADVQIRVLSNEGLDLDVTGSTDTSWNGIPPSFTPTFTGTAYVRVTLSSTTNYPGTYGIVYATGASATRPEVPTTP
jgi:hypothetical protein